MKEIHLHGQSVEFKPEQDEGLVFVEGYLRKDYAWVVHGTGAMMTFLSPEQLRIMAKLYKEMAMRMDQLIIAGNPEPEPDPAETPEAPAGA
jgi:hypothetical protein